MEGEMGEGVVVGRKMEFGWEEDWRLMGCKRVVDGR